jgi:D-glutamate N-acetyltransferase
MTAGRSWLVLTDGYLTAREAKTAHGVIRYARDPIRCVLDRDYAAKNLAEVMPELGRDVPIVGSLQEALRHQPTSLLLGVATPGGWIPDHWRALVVEGIENGLEIVNGLHGFLKDDPDLVALAEENGVRLWDVREPPRDLPLCAGKALEAPQHIVHTVGSDCAIGKMSVSLELAASGADAGVATEFVATGQTGILIAGRGIAVDRVISDFLSGAAEKLVLESNPSSEVLIVEGQGGLWHPAYGAVTLGLLYGCAPEVLVLCHKAGHTAIDEPPYTLLPPLTEMIAAYEQAAATVRTAKVACIAINCKGLSAEQARRTIEETEASTGLPSGDVFAGDAPKLWDAVAAALPAASKPEAKK